MEKQTKSPKSGANLFALSGALVGTALGIALALVPMFIFPQPVGDPGKILLGATIVATFVFGFFGLILGGYIDWRFLH